MPVRIATQTSPHLCRRTLDGTAGSKSVPTRRAYWRRPGSSRLSPARLSQCGAAGACVRVRHLDRPEPDTYGSREPLRPVRHMPCGLESELFQQGLQAPLVRRLWMELDFYAHSRRLGGPRPSRRARAMRGGCDTCAGTEGPGLRCKPRVRPSASSPGMRVRSLGLPCQRTAAP